MFCMILKTKILKTKNFCRVIRRRNRKDRCTSVDIKNKKATNGMTLI